MQFILLLILISLIIKLTKSIEKNFILPFQFRSFNINNNNINSKETDFLYELAYSQIITTIKIGTPSKAFNFTISLQNYLTYILSSDFTLKKIKDNSSLLLFNKENSETYLNNTNLEYFDEELISSGYYSSDIFIFENENEIKKFNFILGMNVYDEKLLLIYNNSANLGFKLTQNYNFLYESENSTILKNLYENHVIKQMTFTLEFNNSDDNNNKINNFFNDKGNLIFDIDFSDANKYFIIKTGLIENIMKNYEWAFNFDYLYYGDIEIDDVQNCLIESEFGLILGTDEFKKIIDENFFNKYYTESCILKKTDKIYDEKDYVLSYYECNKNININYMNDIVFRLTINEFNIVFNSNDLFIDFNDKKIFLIVFKDFNKNWIFGRIFLKKYQTFFDKDKKILGFKKSEIKNKNRYNIKFVIIIIFLSLFILGLICFIVYLYLFKKIPRKFRSNEIIEEYNYIPQN